ncbi:response regulator [[Eubacterium] cellulosolvens]
MEEDNNNKTRVLIVDDEKIITMQISKLLTREGYEVVGTAPDGMEAVKMANELRPDLILMDLVMPRENGIDAIREIIESNPEVKIIVVTGLHAKSTLKEALEAGAKDGVFKPFKEAELLEVIRKYET